MSEVLCVDTKALRESDKMQKKIRLEDILVNHSKFLEVNEENEKSGYCPVSFCTSVRSLYTNRVLYREDNNHRLAYHTFTDVEKMIHKGYDLVMFLASQSFVSMVKNVTDIEIQSVMGSGSTFQCFGMYYDGVLNPIVYSQVIIADEAFPLLKKHYADGVNDMLIRDLKESYSQGNISVLLNELVELKGVRK